MNIRERSDGRLEGRLTINSQRKSFYGSTKTEIKQQAKEYLLKIENGFVEPKRVILNDYIEYWLKTYKLNKIEPSSYTRIYRVYECQIKNTIGTKLIGDITTKDIQRLIDEHANPTQKSIKPLALSGLKKIIHLLNPCMNMAVKEGIISNNPCKDVIIPKESCICVDTKEQFSLSDKEIEEFREAALSRYKTSHEYRSRDALVLLLILNLGLRVGEMICLEWKDIDIERGTININKIMQSNLKNLESDSTKKNYSRVKKSSKTKSGNRVLPINDMTEFYLNEIKEYDKRNKIDCKYVCCTSVNTQQTCRNLQRSLNRLISRTNISGRVSLHTLRHTFGSTLIRRGVRVEIVSKLMGHANITITYNKYIHTIQEEQAIAMKSVTVC